MIERNGEIVKEAVEKVDNATPISDVTGEDGTVTLRTFQSVVT